MGAPAVALQPRVVAAAPLRLLHGWHLFSLDAPTVAFCWMLLFASALHVPHAIASAAALACAVWIIYAADRVLDAWREPPPAWSGAWTGAPHTMLARLYSRNAREFLLAVGAVALLLAALLADLPRALSEAWMLLATPLALYAAAVHLLHLSGRWKAISVGLFFAVAVSIPAAVHGAVRSPLLAGAFAFGAVCRTNCAVLRAPVRRLRIVLTCSLCAALLPFLFAETRSIGLACLASLALLMVLVHKRASASARLGALSWRALVDAALVAPPLIVLAGCLLAR